MWITIYLYLFTFSFLICLLLTPLLRKLAFRLNILDMPSQRKIHTIPKPLLGGVALYFSFTITILVNLLLLKLLWKNLELFHFIPSSLIENLPPFERELKKLLPFFLGGTLIVLLGVIDDIRKLSAFTKVFSSALIALMMVLLGVRISLFIPNPFLGGFLTVAWIVLITNTFNMLDNMDGLACGVALIASFIFFGITSFQDQLFTSSMLIVFAGSLAGFLIFNWYPSSIFMGDAGSMWIGFTLATLTILATFYSEGKPTLFPVIMPLLILGVPIFDAISVMTIRLVRKKPLFVGDKNHFSHRLVQLGMTQPQAVAFIYLVTFCVGINATLLAEVPRIGAIVILLQAVVIFVIIALLEYVGRRSLDRKE